MSLLADLWSAPGRRQLFVSKGDLRRNIDVSSPDQAIKVALAADAQGADVYFAMAAWSATSTGRKGADVVSCGALWADLDCGPDEDYPTQLAALQALAAWLKQVAFPAPSHVVSSGAGLHVYWQLTTELSAAEWRPLAQTLKDRWEADEFKFDPSRTADIASVLRIPGTRRHKDTQLLPVRLLKSSTPVTVEAIRAVLGTGHSSLPPADRSDPLLAWNGPKGDELLIRSKCAQLAHVRNARGAVAEPLWRAALSIVTRCEDGDSLIHEYSKGDSRYTPQATVEKAAGTAGPHSCRQFGSHNPELCKACPHKGKVTSPIMLGVKAPDPAPAGDPWPKAAVGPFVVSRQGVHMNVPDEPALRVSMLPIWGEGFGIDADELIADRGATLILGYIDPRGVRRRTVLPLTAMASVAKLTEWTASAGIISFIDRKAFMQYISEIDRSIQTEREATKLYRTSGWDNEDGFIVGSTIYTAEGPKPCAVKTPHADSEKLVPTGTLEGWKATVNSLREDNYRAKSAVLFGLGAPMLANSNGKNSAVIAYVGSDPGVGKSLIAKLALSVYGDPELLAIEGNFTPAGLNEALRGVKNMPFLLDETTTMSAKKLQDLVYKAVSGKGTGRSNEHLRVEDAGKWALPLLVTSNTAFMDLDQKDFKEAVRSRVVEIECPKRHMMSAEECAALYRGMTANYGTAAPVMLGWMAAHRAELPALFEQCVKIVESMQQGLPQRARFGSWALASGLAGGLIAKKLGIITWDVLAPIKFVAKLLKTQHGEIDDDATRVGDAIAEFVLSRNQDVIHWDRHASAAGARGDARNPVGRRVKEGTYLLISALKTHLVSQGISSAGLRDWATSKCAAHCLKRQFMCLSPGAPQTWCYFFPERLLEATSSTPEFEDK